MNGSVKRLWVDGVTSSVAVAMTAALRSRIEGHSVWRPINAISHIIWGRFAARHKDAILQKGQVGLQGAAKGLIEADQDRVKLIYALPKRQTPTDFKAGEQHMFVLAKTDVTTLDKATPPPGA